MSACQNCGGPLLPSKNPGNPRKWCSERCRKAQYHKPCIDCGTLVDGTTPSRFSGRCSPCHAAFWASNGERADMRRSHERALRIVEWWADGLTLREIAQQLGCSFGHIKVEFHRLREKGYDLPYRYKSHPRRKAVVA